MNYNKIQIGEKAKLDQLHVAFPISCLRYLKMVSNDNAL